MTWIWKKITGRNKDIADYIPDRKELQESLEKLAIYD